MNKAVRTNPARSEKQDDPLRRKHPKGSGENAKKAIARFLPEAEEEESDGEKSHHDSAGHKLANQDGHT